MRKRAYVFDIDGTMSLVGDRLECLTRKPPNWDEFYQRCGEDKPNTPVVDICRLLIDCGRTVVFLTGRRYSVRHQTRTWLYKHGIVNYHELLMRPDGDLRPDTIVKPELLDEAEIDPIVILEDRQSVVNRWRELGYTSWQVAPGDF